MKRKQILVYDEMTISPIKSQLPTSLHFNNRPSNYNSNNNNNNNSNNN